MTDKLKVQILEANLQLQKMGLVIFTWGNASGIDRQRGQIIIKPSGVPYNYMSTKDLVTVDLDGNVLEGDYKPSSDLATHLEIYRNFPECGGVVHTHSRMATAWSQAGRDLPTFGTTHADYFYGAIPCTRALTEDEIQGAYEIETGRVIVETFRERSLDPVAIPGVLINGHGPFTWGKDAMEAMHNTVVLEEIAHIALSTLAINQQSEPISQILLDKHYLRKHGTDAYYGQK